MIRSPEGYPLLFDLDDYERIVGRPWQSIVSDLQAPVRSSISRGLKAQVWDKTAGLCWYCHEELNPFRDFTVDHVVPLARGGSNHIENLVPACGICNMRKGAR